MRLRMIRIVSRFIVLLLILACAAGCKNSSSGRESDGTQHEDLVAQSIEIVPAGMFLGVIKLTKNGQMKVYH